ncbi:ATP-binding cassette domain-containing protein, partial [Candidatus Woesearchaeota archaeon]|nr:ATP-binding cassette domain-containing protein [Candidatus Woesearchaeota archaeon]
MKKEIIRLDNVWKIYKMGNVSISATKNISMTVYKGQFLAITGNSGSGKSTVMHLIGCLDIPSKGKLFLDTNDVSKLTESELAQIRGRKIGFVFQQFNLIPTLTALENVALPGEFQNMEKTFLYKKDKELL